MHVNVRHDAAAEGIVLQVVEHAIHLIHHAFLVLMLHAELISIGLADGAVRVRPLIPNVAVQIMNVVGLLLPDPKDLVRCGLERRLSERHDREFLGKVVAIYHAKLLDRICARAVRPVRTHLLPFRARSILQNVLTHVDKNFVCVTHPLLLPHSISNFESCFFSILFFGFSLGFTQCPG